MGKKSGKEMYFLSWIQSVKFVANPTQHWVPFFIFSSVVVAASCYGVYCKDASGCKWPSLVKNVQLNSWAINLCVCHFKDNKKTYIWTLQATLRLSHLQSSINCLITFRELSNIEDVLLSSLNALWVWNSWKMYTSFIPHEKSKLVWYPGI